MNRPACRRSVPALLLAVIALLPCTLIGQEGGEKLNRPPKCEERDLEIHFDASKGPRDYFNLAITGRNVSDHACWFDSFDFYVSMSSYDSNWEKSPQNRTPPPDCHDCQYYLHEGKEATAIPPLRPGDTVREKFRWSTTPPKPGLVCYDAEWISTPFWIFSAPSLLKNVCSQVSVTAEEVIPASQSISHSEVSGDDKQTREIELSTSKTTYNKGEHFALQVRSQSGNVVLEGEDACPTFFVYYRSESGHTRTDEEQPLAFKGCPTTTFDDAAGDWSAGFRVDSGAVSMWGEVGEAELQVFEKTGPDSNGHFHLIPSNIVHVRTRDPEEMTRNWSRANGIAADISLDKDTYRVGEDIPLHIAIANFDAEKRVYGTDPIGLACLAVGLEVFDAAGYLLPERERVNVFSPCSGDVVPPLAFEKGKVYPLEFHLKSMGWLPKHPGTYTIVLTWCTETGSYEFDEQANRYHYDLSPYATVRAAATVHILERAEEGAR